MINAAHVLDGLQFGFRRKLPMILQTEAAECGVACLAMIAGYYGHEANLASLRRRFCNRINHGVIGKELADG